MEPTRNDLEAIRSGSREAMRELFPQILTMKYFLQQLQKAHCYHWKRFTQADEKLAHVQVVVRKRKEIDVDMMLAGMTREQKEEMLSKLKEV